MNLLLALWLICAVPTYDTGSISSKNASYDGNGLVLKGDVVLDHSLGMMEADEASLQKQEVGQTFPFSFIHLEKHVSLKLQNDAKLNCDAADLDFATLKGALTSQDRVIYSDTLKKLQLLGRTIDLQFIKRNETAYDIQNIVANDNVELTYANDYVLTTDAVLYQKELIDGASRLCSYGKEKSYLTYQGNQVVADRFDLDIVHTKLLLTNPEGTLPSLSKGVVQFTAESLTWDHEQSLLVLKGDPRVLEPQLGTLVSNQEIHLFQTNQKLAGFKCFGKSTLTYLNAHQLISHGTIFFDRFKQSGYAESPLINGTVPEGLQLYYEEGEMVALADKATIEYTETQEAFSPVSLALKGNVKIFSKSKDRLGVADRLTYNPTTRTFILGADPGKKVLFVNDQDNLRISAQEVHITQDPVSKKQIVKGVGHVQLALSSEEEFILNKNFIHE
jgi:lipopolysaccharide export system protein LptA